MRPSSPDHTPAHAAAQVFVTDLDRPEPEATDAHHLQHVLRLRQGELVIAADGRGGSRLCAYRGARSSRPAAAPVLDPIGAVTATPPRSPRISIGFAIAKGDRPEWVVSKLTELGVDTIVPTVSDRCVVRPGAESLARRSDRLRRVAREAAMQCRRTDLPVVAEIVPFESVLERVLAPAARGMPAASTEMSFGGTAVLAVRGGSAPSDPGVLVLTGPEGGWSERELAHQLPTVGLGDHVMRADTAPIAAAVLLTALRAGLVRTL